MHLIVTTIFKIASMYVAVSNSNKLNSVVKGKLIKYHHILAFLSIIFGCYILFSVAIFNCPKIYGRCIHVCMHLCGKLYNRKLFEDQKKIFMFLFER